MTTTINPVANNNARPGPRAVFSGPFAGIVRPSAPQDEPAILSLLLELQAHECGLHPGLRQWSDADAKTYWELVRRKVEGNRGVCLLAEVDGPAGKSVIGLSFGWVEHDAFAVRMAPEEISYGHLVGGYVKEDYRRAGVFTRLIGALENHFAEQGLKRIRRETFANNTGLLAAANAQGYQLYEIRLEKALG